LQVIDSRAWPQATRNLPVQPPGLTTDQLYSRVRDRRERFCLNAHELERWLVEEGLARSTDAGTLLPTWRCVELNELLSSSR
jgi:hypothetical protein